MIEPEPGIVEVEGDETLQRMGLGCPDVPVAVAALGYRGDYSFEVVHDDYQQMPLPLVAQRGRRSAEWLGEEVRRRSVPLPGSLRLRSTA